MIAPLQLVWIAFIAFLFLILLVLMEMHRINYRRENEEIFGTDEFNRKVKEFGLQVKEQHTLDKLVRKSTYENKDAVLNSSNLFENAVTNFYEFRNVEHVRDETLESVALLRKTLGFTASNPLATVVSTRQFNVRDRVDLVFDNGRVSKHSEILFRSERDWTISYDGSSGPGRNFEGEELLVRWTRPNDAVYSAHVKVKRCIGSSLVLEHTSVLDKVQLRRWVREQVSFPVEAIFADGTTCEGRLFDLSAGGILIGLPKECPGGTRIRIKFELPSFGPEDVEIDILRCLGNKNVDYPHLFCLTAAFAGAFGWTQERVLQYIFEVHRKEKYEKHQSENV